MSMFRRKVVIKVISSSICTHLSQYTVQSDFYSRIVLDTKIFVKYTKKMLNNIRNIFL